MWLKHSEFLRIMQRNTDLETRLSLERAAREDLHRQFQEASRQFEASNALGYAEIRKLLERLITAEAESRKGQALVAMWAIRINQLQSERDQLLAKLVPVLDIQTPHVGPGMISPADISFEHDPHAVTHPVDDTQLIPLGAEDLDLGGLTGQTYNPGPSATQS